MPLPSEDVEATTPKFLRDKYAIAGVGETTYTRGSDKSTRAMASIAVRNAMASDLGYGDVTAAPVIAAAEQGQDVKIVSITSRSLADLVLIVMPDSPLKTAADLKGKKFGISNPKSLGEMMGVLVMAQAYVWPFTALVVH